MKNNEPFTVITGASQGLGKELALQCAQLGRNLILVSLPNEGLRLFATELESDWQIRCVTFELDLTSSNEMEDMVQVIRKNYRVLMLVNNVGMGGTKSFTDVSISALDAMILLNIRVMVALTKSLMPLLRREEKAHVLNISSMAAFGFIPYKTIYPASKAFVSSFSKSLRSELRGSSVSVSVAYPGGMLTTESIRRRVEGYNKLIQTTFLSPEFVAQVCLHECLEGRFRIIPGVMNKFCRLLLNLCPSWLQMRLFSNAMETEFKSGVVKRVS